MFFLFPEMEDAKKNAETAALQSPPPPVTTATPDYAAGLTSTPTYAPPTPQPAAALTGKVIFLFIYYFCNYFNFILTY